VKIDQKETDRRIKDIAKNQSNFKEKDNKISENGDLVAFDYEATINDKPFENNKGKNTQIVLGKDLFIKGFDAQLKGVKKGENKEVNVILPESYPQKEYAKKKAKFNCTILAVKEPCETIVDDQFAKNLGAKDLEDLKKLITKQINEEYKNSLDTLTKNKILKEIEKFKVEEIPQNLVDQEVKILSQGMKGDEAKKTNKDLEEKSKKRIKVGLILNAFGEENKVQVEEKEIQTEIQKQLAMMPGQEKIVMDYYKENPSATDGLRGQIYENKIIDLIKSKIKLTKKEITKEEAEKLIQSEHKSHDHKHNNDDKKKVSNKPVKAKVKKTISKTIKSSLKKPEKKKKVSKK
jgi:trigger factor